MIARRQALVHGLTGAQWRWRLESGRWQTLLPGIAATHSGGIGEQERQWAAVLWGGRDAALTGDAALRLWGLSVPEPDPWPVAVPAHRSIAPQLQAGTPGHLLRVRPHRVHLLSQLTHPVRTPSVLRPAPAVLQAAAWAVSARAAEWRVAAAVQQRVVTVSQLRAAQQLLLRLPRRRLVATVLDDVEMGAHARSELDLLDFLRRHHLPLPDRMQLRVRVGTGRRYLDAWWERRRVSLEMDGAHHRFAGTWEADLLRAGDIAVAHRDSRVLMLRFTPGNLRHDELHVAGLLRAALR